MPSDFTVLTVCTGNIHRSPLAAALLETWAGWYLPAALSEQVHVESAGLAAPVGAPMGDEVQAIARALGADGSEHGASRLTDSDVSSADLVLVATRRQRDEVLSRVPSALRKTFTMREAGRIAATLESSGRVESVADLVRTIARLADNRSSGVGASSKADDVIDPHGKADEAYTQMAREEVVALVQLARVLFGMPRGDVEAYWAAAEDAEFLRAGGAGSKPR